MVTSRLRRRRNDPGTLAAFGCLSVVLAASCGFLAMWLSFRNMDFNFDPPPVPVPPPDRTGEYVAMVVAGILATAGLVQIGIALARHLRGPGWQPRPEAFARPIEPAKLHPPSEANDQV